VNRVTFVGIVAFALAVPVALFAESGQPTTDTPQESTVDAKGPGVAIIKVIDIVASKTGKKFILDPRVHANVQIVGEDLNHLTYVELLTILPLYGFTAVESGGFVLVVPQTNIRAMPLPQIAGKETYPDSQYVSIVIPVTKLPAGSLVPILRPLLPPYAHLAAASCSNSLLMVDTYANVRRIESLVKALDTGEPYQPAKCEAPGAKPATSADSKPS
jgi:general secretion pathway protein D